MFGVRPSSLFRSRWLALGWAVFICLIAIGFAAGRGNGGENDAAPDNAAVEMAIGALD